MTRSANTKRRKSKKLFTSSWEQVVAKNFKVEAKGLRAARTAFQRRVDTKRLNSAVYERLVRLWSNAARAFIRAAVYRTAVETGMSAATLFPLSRLIQERGIGPSVDQVITQRINSGRAESGRTSYKTHPTFPVGDRKPGRQNPSRGEALAESRRAGTFSVGNENRILLQFSFFPAVWQYNFSESKGHTSALEAGFNAFSQVIEDRPALIGQLEIREYLRETSFRI